jgi:hypothetical protein
MRRSIDPLSNATPAIERNVLFIPVTDLPSGIAMAAGMKTPKTRVGRVSRRASLVARQELHARHVSSEKCREVGDNPDALGRSGARWGALHKEVAFLDLISKPAPAPAAPAPQPPSRPSA